MQLVNTIKLGMLALGIACGLAFVAEPARRLADGAAPVVVATSAAELAGVTGLQEPVSPVPGTFEEGKCCGVGGACTPVPPAGKVVCTTVYVGTEPDGCGSQEDAECYSWTGNPVRDGACVSPPPGMVGPMRCAMDPGSYRCRPYRTGVCDTVWVPVWDFYCECDLDSDSDSWALGQKKCAYGSTICAGVVTPVGTTTTGH